MAKSWADGSKWVAIGDSLHLTLSTMSSGWVLRLVHAPANWESTYAGVARYLTEVVAVDAFAWHPPQVAVRVRRERCPPPA